MYEVDNKDKVIELKDFPQSSIGAPIPTILASEHKVAIAYYLQNTPSDWDGTTVKVMDESSIEPVAIVVFERCYAKYFGPPNDEAFEGHPLANTGLTPYACFEVMNSSWIRKLERMNSVHPYHDKQRFLSIWRHFILAFHDSIFECIATDYSISTEIGSIEDIIPKMAKHIQ